MQCWACLHSLFSCDMNTLLFACCAAFSGGIRNAKVKTHLLCVCSNDNTVLLLMGFHAVFKLVPPCRQLMKYLAVLIPLLDTKDSTWKVISLAVYAGLWVFHRICTLSTSDVPFSSRGNPSNVWEDSLIFQTQPGSPACGCEEPSAKDTAVSPNFASAWSTTRYSLCTYINSSSACGYIASNFF